MPRTRSISGSTVRPPKADSADRPGASPVAAGALARAGEERLRPLLSVLAERNAKRRAPV
jgi:hypothetical protein